MVLLFREIIIAKRRNKNIRKYYEESKFDESILADQEYINVAIKNKKNSLEPDPNDRYDKDLCDIFLDMLNSNEEAMIKMKKKKMLEKKM